MFSAKTIDAQHKDLIHDVSYDFYGKRFATCSSDQIVKIWDQDDEGNWSTSAEWKAHQGSIWKVTWAHPEFGQVIATCSFDRTVVIWEENPKGGDGRNKPSWLRRAGLVDSRSSVTDVRFAPKHLGLIVASCSSDGSINIYEAPDVMNLSHWTAIHSINTNVSLSSLSWNPSPFHPPMIAVGSNDDGTSGYNVSGFESSSSGGNPKVMIFEASEASRTWFKVEVVPFITDPVHDVSFAPNIGRDDHVLAIASGKDVRIVSIKPVSSSNQWSESQGLTSPVAPLSLPKYKIKQLAHFTDHVTKVWRVSWNIMGTILGSSSEDGVIKLWKSNYLDNWTSIGTIRTDEKSGVPGSHFSQQRGMSRV